MGELQRNSAVIKNKELKKNKEKLLFRIFWPYHPTKCLKQAMVQCLFYQVFVKYIGKVYTLPRSPPIPGP